MSRLFVWGLGWLWWTVLPIRKRLAVEQYARCFPDRPASDLRRTVGELVWGYVELFAGRRADFPTAGLCAEGGIALAGHGGAWDIALVTGGLHFPITIFVKPPASRLAARLIDRVRRATDIELLPPHGSMDAAYDALARGRLVAFVQDQRHNAGIEADFFGRPARTSAAFAAMAHKTRAPLFGIWQYRDESGHHVVAERLDWEIPGDREQAIEQLTRRSQDWYADKIRGRPYSWLWLHDRWRPSGDPQP